MARVNRNLLLGVAVWLLVCYGGPGVRASDPLLDASLDLVVEVSGLDLGDRERKVWLTLAPSGEERETLWNAERVESIWVQTRVVLCRELGPGSWTLQLVQETDRGLRSLGIWNTVVEAHGFSEIELRVTPRVVKGRLALSGDAVIDARIGLRGTGNVPGTTDEQGRFEVPTIERGPWVMRVQPRGDTEDEDGEATSFDLVVEPGETVTDVTGRVIQGWARDAGGGGVSGAKILARTLVPSSDPYGRPTLRELESSTQAAPDGSFELFLPDHPNRSDWSLRAEAEGLAAGPAPVAEETLLILERESVVRGTVVDPAGEPVLGALVRIQLYDPVTGAHDLVLETTTDRRGRFSVWTPYLPILPVSLVVEAEGRPVTAYRGLLVDGFSLVVGAASGELSLVLPAPTLPGTLDRLSLVSGETGGELRIGETALDRSLDPPGLVMPRLAAGVWMVVVRDDLETVSAVSQNSSSFDDPLARGELSSDGALRLELSTRPRE